MFDERTYIPASQREHIARLDTNGAGQAGWANDNDTPSLRRRLLAVLLAAVKMF